MPTPTAAGNTSIGCLLSSTCPTRKKPSKKQYKDIEFGVKIARKIAELDIGQTIVVKDGAVLSVEAMEGTDMAIKRGASFSGAGAVVIKSARPLQDMRYDIPIIGRKTIKALKQAGIAVIVFSANKTLMLDRKRLVEDADSRGICMVAREI